MYSPKIREELVPKIYRAAKAAGIAMTTWVNCAIERALAEITVSEPGTGDGKTDGIAKRRSNSHDGNRT